MLENVLLGVVVIGIVHGLEPGHGWPIALLYSSRKRQATFHALASSSIIAFSHFISSIAVVVLYLVLANLFNVVIPFARYIGAGVLIILAIRFFRENPGEKNHGHFHDDFKSREHVHEHSHGEKMHSHVHRHMRKVILSLYGIASFALVLGFVHEEEFMLLSLAVGGIDPVPLMIPYASAVSISLVSITLVSLKVYRRLQERFGGWESRLPKISGIILIATALSLIFL